MWVDTADLPTNDGHPYFERLNRVLADSGFDAFVEELWRGLLRGPAGTAESASGSVFPDAVHRLFRGSVVGARDCVAGGGFAESAVVSGPGADRGGAGSLDALSRTRRRIDVETHEAVFTWILERLSAAGLVRGKTVGIDATTLEANAAMRSIERRDTGESYEAFVRSLAEASGVETPTRADLARFDRSRKNKKTSNKEWKSPQDPDAKVAKRTVGRTWPTRPSTGSTWTRAPSSR